MIRGPGATSGDEPGGSARRAVLLTYALSGAIPLLFRKRQQKTLLWWAGGLFALPIVAIATFLTLYFSRFHRPWMDPKPPDVKKLYAIISIYAHGTLRQIFSQNWSEWKRELPSTLFAIYALALFLLGMWVWRTGIAQRLDEYRPVLKRVCAWCIPAGLITSIFVAIVKASVPPGSFSLWAWRLSSSTRIGDASYSHLPRLGDYTTGLYGRIGPAIGLAPTVILYEAQVVFSNWWVKRYRFGPMEWLWRGMTYGKFPSMRKEEPMPAIEVPSLSSSPVTLSDETAE